MKDASQFTFECQHQSTKCDSYLRWLHGHCKQMFFTMENHENVSEQQLENQYVGQQFLNQTALKVLV